MLSQLSYFPTWTPQRGVARYVCHSSAAVKSFLCTGRPLAGREWLDNRGMQGLVSYEAGSGKREDLLAPVTAGMGRKCHVRHPLHFSKAFPPWYAGRRAPAFPNTCGKASHAEAGWHGNALTVRTQGASLARVLGLATFTPRCTKPEASPGPLLPPSLKKIGRAAPVGLGYREKKRYRSPLVSL